MKATYLKYQLQLSTNLQQKLGLFVVFLFLNCIAFSQTYSYHTFPKDSALWKYKNFSDWNPPGSPLITYSSTTYIKDTADQFPVMRSSLGAYYEQNKQVFFKHNQDSAYRLLYDFNLTVGDTFVNKFNIPMYPEYWGGDSLYFVVSDDSISTQNPDWFGRRSIKIQSVQYGGWYSSLWVEGVGNVSSTAGIEWALIVGGGYAGKRLECVFSDSTSFPCADAFMLNLEEPVQETFSLYPNPNSGSFTLKFEEVLLSGSLEIYSLNGQLVFQQNIAQTNKIDLDLYLPKGLYILRLNTQGQNLTQRFIIH